GRVYLKKKVVPGDSDVVLRETGVAVLGPPKEEDVLLLKDKAPSQERPPLHLQCHSGWHELTYPDTMQKVAKISRKVTRESPPYPPLESEQWGMGEEREEGKPSLQRMPE